MSSFVETTATTVLKVEPVEFVKYPLLHLLFSPFRRETEQKQVERERYIIVESTFHSLPISEPLF